MNGENNSFNILSSMMNMVQNHLSHPTKDRRYKGMKVRQPTHKRA